MAKTYYAALERPPIEMARFQLAPLPLAGAKLEVTLQCYSILTTLEVTLREGVLPLVVEVVRLNDEFVPTLYVPYSQPGVSGEEPLFVSPPVVLGEGEPFSCIVHAQLVPDVLKRLCYPKRIEKVTLSTNCGELVFERAE